MKNNNNYLSCLGAIVLFVGLLAISAVINGLVFAILWDWFVVTSFNAPRLSIPVAIGLGIITRMAVQIPSSKKDETPASETIAVTLFSPFVTLGFAWIVYQFV